MATVISEKWHASPQNIDTCRQILFWFFPEGHVFSHVRHEGLRVYQHRANGGVATRVE
jgi:hypothetical protein